MVFMCHVPTDGRARVSERLCHKRGLQSPSGQWSVVSGQSMGVEVEGRGVVRGNKMDRVAFREREGSRGRSGKRGGGGGGHALHAKVRYEKSVIE